MLPVLLQKVGEKQERGACEREREREGGGRERGERETDSYKIILYLHHLLST